MKKNTYIYSLTFFILSFMLPSGIVYSQTAGKVEVYGKMVHSFTRRMVHEKINIEILDQDSTLIDTLTTIGGSSQGNRFFIYLNGTPKTKKNFIARFSHPDFETVYQPFTVLFRKRDSILPLGDIVIRKLSKTDKEMQLGEVVVKATKVKFFYKGDTIVYNADAFHLAEGSMLDALISQLPGAELKDDGRIYVNGRFVDNLLLNGKDFFKGKNNIMLENLPAYTVKELKVYEEESELSKMLGTKVDEGRYVMDVRLKREYKIGWLANTEWAGGTKERYIGRLFALRFTPHSRLSFFANMNNLNDTRKPGRNGEWSPSNLNGGLTSTKTGGFDYMISDKRMKYDLEGYVQATHTDNDYQRTMERQNFLPGGDTYERSWYKADNKNTQIYTTHDLKFYLGKEKWSNYIRLKPQFKYQKTDNRSDLLSGTFHLSPSEYKDLYDSLYMNRLDYLPILNRNRQERSGKGNNLNANLSAESYIKLPYSNDGLYLEAGASYNKFRNEAFGKSSLYYPAGNKDLRNQYADTPNKRQEYYFTAEYYIRTKHWLLRPYYSITHTRNENHNDLYRLDRLDSWDWDNELGMLPSAAEDLMRILDPRNSYSTEEYSTQQYLSFVFMLNYRKWKNRKGEESLLYLRMEPFACVYEDKRFYFKGAKDDSKRLHRWRPAPSFYSTYNTPGYRHELNLDYTMDVSTPSMFNLIDLTFDSDPLNIRKGNPHLKNTVRHKVDFRYKADKWLHGTGRMLSGNAGHSRVHNAVAMGYVYDKQTGIRTYRPENVNGNWDVWTHVYFTTPLDKDRKWTLNTATQVDYGHNMDLVSLDAATAPASSTVRQVWARENLSVDFRFGKHRAGVRARAGYSNVQNNREGFEKINAGNFDYGMNALFQLPWGFQLSTDLTMYSRRGYSNEAMNTDELVWNARLTKSILHGNLTFTLDGFDILGQLSNTNYSINGQGRTETWVNSIPQYAMLRVMYKLNRQPKKK